MQIAQRSKNRNKLRLPGTITITITITYTAQTITVITVTLDQPATPRLTKALYLLLDEITHPAPTPRLPGDRLPIILERV